MGQTGLQGGEGAGNLIQSYIPLFNQACLHNETLIKTLDTKAHSSILVGEHIWRMMSPDSSRTEHASPASPIAHFLQVLPCMFLHLAVSDLHPL